MLHARIACAFVCLTWLATAYAEELSERQFLEEFPTVLSASRLRQNARETPQAITVIDQAMIKASGAREFAELFRLVPGFTVSYVTYVKGLQPIVTYHGLGREFFSRLQVLIDGRSINNATLGGVDWSEFPFTPDDIDHIEVVRGPSNATHGIGAFLATINFVTKHALLERGAALQANAGSAGIRDASARLGSGGGNFDYRLVAGHRADDGFADIADHRERNFFSARADWQTGPIDNVVLQAGATDGTNEVSFRGLNDPQRDVQVRTAYAQAKWDRSYDADNGFFVQMYYYHFRLGDEFTTLQNVAAPGAGPRTIDGGSMVSRTDLEAQQNLSFDPALRWVWGGSVREDLTDVPLLFSSTKALRIARLFGHVEWHESDKLLLNAGAMVENNGLTGTDVAPQLALNYQLDANQTVRFNVSRALRTPTVIENQGKFAAGSPGTPRFGPSGDLLPEQVLSREISYVAEWPEQHATLDLKLFDDDVRDLIDLIGVRNDAAAEAFPRNAVNADSARERGIEGQFVWRPSTANMLLLSTSYLHIDSPDHLDNYSRSAPHFTVHFLASHRFADSWDASVTVHGQSAFRASGFSQPQSGFVRLDSSLAREFPLWRGQAEVALTLENALDRHYTDYRQDDVAERRLWLSFRYTLP